ncbi:MAG: hypothetical protein QM523_00460 [Candidatus Pacebacteria bacterium]|nr:hypothetical protein [Candidatus Paceibacterota bacterium]
MEHHLAQVKPQASLNKMSALKPIEGEVNLDKILARGGEMDKLIVEQIPKELINDPIEWEKQYRAILKNYMDQNHGAGSTILEADVYHLNGKTVTPAESSVAFEQQTKLNTAVNLLPDHWIKQANSYQKDGKARRLNILLQKPKRESFRGDLHAINASTETVYSTFLHEFIHGMQRVRPDIDKIVQELHIRRTSNKKGGRQALRRIYENKAEETGRKDKYTDPYFGKQYKNAVYNGDGGAREVFTMSFQHVLRGEDRPFEGQPNDWLHRLKTQQGGHGQEIINLVLGLLTGM